MLDPCQLTDFIDRTSNTFYTVVFWLSYPLCPRRAEGAWGDDQCVSTASGGFSRPRGLLVSLRGLEPPGHLQEPQGNRPHRLWVWKHLRGLSCRYHFAKYATNEQEKWAVNQTWDTKTAIDSKRAVQDLSGLCQTCWWSLSLPVKSVFMSDWVFSALVLMHFTLASTDWFVRAEGGRDRSLSCDHQTRR